MFYYLIVVLLVLYVLGLSSLVGQQGERYRFPVLAALFPLAALNLQSFIRRVAKARPGAKDGGRVLPRMSSMAGPQGVDE